MLKQTRLQGAVLALLTLLACGCGGGTTPAAGGVFPPPPPPQPSTSPVPLTDMGTNNYLGFSGGLYPNASNSIPAVHLNAGVGFANSVQPLDTSGNPATNGRIAMVSIGMSNTTQEYCSDSSFLPCSSWTFVGQALADPLVNQSTLFFVNGARDSRTAALWESPTSAEYDRVLQDWLQPNGLSERQVQIAWVKVANPNPAVSLPSANSDAITLLRQLGNIARALKVRYPNMKLVFISSRIYAGYASTTLNPEPYAYEYGFSVKWLIEAQIAQMQNGGVVVDSRAGDLNYNTVAPFLAWGPYLWADGLNLRSDGLNWLRADFRVDGTHPSQSGAQKVGQLMLSFFKTSPITKCWFLAFGACP
jgi:hypothetical protein